MLHLSRSPPLLTIMQSPPHRSPNSRATRPKTSPRVHCRHARAAAAERTFERPRGRTFTLTEMGDTLYPVAAFDEHNNLAGLTERHDQMLLMMAPISSSEWS